MPLPRSLFLPLMPLLALALTACDGAVSSVALPPVEGIDTLSVSTATSVRGRAWDGVVEAVRQATLTAQTSGRVAEVLHDVNDRVEAGALLVRLSAVEQQAAVDSAEAQLRAAEAVVAEAEASYRRHQALQQQHFVAAAQLDQVRAARDSAVASAGAARAHLASVRQQAGYTLIHAPYAGVIASRDVEPGESVAVGQLLMTQFAPEALRIEVSVPQSVAEAIRRQPQATVQFADGPQVAAAQVTVFPAADAATHAVTVRVQLPDVEPLPRPGATAKVAFAAVEEPRYPRIPATALLRRGELNAVYVLSEGRLSLRQLRLGERAGDCIDVISGLQPGEIIAADPIAAQQALVLARGNG